MLPKLSVLLIFTLLISQSAFAALPKLVSGQLTRYGDEQMSTYFQDIEDAVVTEAIKVCAPLSISKISSVTTHTEAAFSVMENINKTSADSGMVYVIYSALVTCK